MKAVDLASRTTAILQITVSLGQQQCHFHINAEVADRVLELRMTKQIWTAQYRTLHGRSSLDVDRVEAPQRPIDSEIEERLVRKCRSRSEWKTGRGRADFDVEEVTPSKQLDAFAAYRPSWLASHTDSFSTTGVRDTAAASGCFAGHQIEGRVRWWLVPEKLRFEWNGLLLAKGRFLRDAPNAPAGGDTIYNSFNATWSF